MFAEAWQISSVGRVSSSHSNSIKNGHASTVLVIQFANLTFFYLFVIAGKAQVNEVLFSLDQFYQVSQRACVRNTSIETGTHK